MVRMKYRCAHLLLIALGVCRVSDGREGRVIFMDTASNIDVAIQVVVPFGVALPMVKKETSQGRRGRTHYKMADHEHPVYGIRLARFDNYFNQLEVDDETCRQKLLCELAESPEEFYPVSHVFMEQLGFWAPEHDAGRYAQYLMAARHGAMSAVNDTHTGSCEHQFTSCHSNARRIFDMDALNFWKFLSSTFNFRISH